METNTPTLRLMVLSHALDSITRDMLRRLSCRGIEVIVAGPGEAAAGGVDALPVRSKIDRQASRDYHRVMQEHHIDVAFAPSTSGLAVLLRARKGLDVKVVGYRGTQAKVSRLDPTNWLALLNPGVDHIVCETQDIMQHLSEIISPDKLSYMEKPFDAEWVSESKAAPKWPEHVPDGVFRLVYVGVSKGRPHKGLHVALQAVKLLASHNVWLTVVGEASSEDMEYAASLPVSFMGNRTDAVNYIAAADLYLLTSLRDASPRTVREALACGVPCVVSNIPGARDLIAPGLVGMLFTPSDQYELADIIEDFIDEPERLKAMSSNTADYLRQRFDPEAYADYFAGVVRAVAASCR